MWPNTNKMRLNIYKMWLNKNKMRLNIYKVWLNINKMRLNIRWDWMKIRWDWIYIYKMRLNWIKIYKICEIPARYLFSKRYSKMEFTSGLFFARVNFIDSFNNGISWVISFFIISVFSLIDSEFAMMEYNKKLIIKK